MQARLSRLLAIKHYEDFFKNLGAFLALRAKNRAFRSKSSESADALSCGLSTPIPGA
jgi:hypothetical protein